MYSCKPQFYYMKMEFKGGQNYTCGFRDVVDVRDERSSLSLIYTVLIKYITRVFILCLRFKESYYDAPHIYVLLI